MAVELAAMVPVVIVVALTAYNLARFVTLCAEFDRVAPDAVVSQGVAPAGTQTTLAASGEVESCIADALGESGSCSVEVAAEPVWASGTPGGLCLSPLLTRFRCTLVYRPWPSSFTIAGVPYESPVALRHERSMVVDRYRPGVVM